MLNLHFLLLLRNAFVGTGRRLDLVEYPIKFLKPKSLPSLSTSGTFTKGDVFPQTVLQNQKVI